MCPSSQLGQNQGPCGFPRLTGVIVEAGVQRLSEGIRPMHLYLFMQFNYLLLAKSKEKYVTG